MDLPLPDGPITATRSPGARDSDTSRSTRTSLPPSNYPRGAKGSTSPAYAGGTVHHYIALMGYDDTGSRAVWVADSGFRPFGYWVSFGQLASLIPPKGYAFADGAPVQAPGALPESRTQVCGGPTGYPGWPQLGGRTLTDGVAEILKALS